MDRSFKVFGYSLSVVIAIIFGTFGMLKVFPFLSPEINKMFMGEFIRYAKIHPATNYGYVIDAGKFMKLIGVVEIMSAVLLVIGPRILKLMSCTVFISIIIGALYFQYTLNEPFLYLFLNSMLLLILFLRLNFFHLQLMDSHVQAEGQTGSQKKKTN